MRVGVGCPVARLSTVGTRAVARVCLVPCAPKAALPLFHTLSASHALGRSSGLSQMRPTLVQTRGLAKRDRRERMAAAVASVKPVADGAVRVRFAPSPTGNLHVGGARTALFNWLYARKTGGKFVVRVEDTDQARSTRESEEAMIRDLKWLGLDWDEGPDKEGDCGPYRQSEREAIYKEYADKLVEGGQAYPCFCTDEELDAMRAHAEANKLPPKYTGKWSSASAEEVQEMKDKGVPFVYRFRVPENELITINDIVRGEVTWNTDTVGDFVLIRSNGLPVYNFCVAIDDATMGITHVLRAEEHLPNTLRQMLVYQALGFEQPQFGHMSLILAPDKSKLSKRHGATSVGDFKEQGYLPEAMVNYLSMLGWNDGSEKEIYTVEELYEAFQLERITKSPAVFDKTKLSWMNGQHLRALPVETSKGMIGEQLVGCGLLASNQGPLVDALVACVQNNLELVADAEKEVRPLLGFPLAETMASGGASKVVEDEYGEIVTAVVEGFESGALPGAIAAGDFKGWVNGVGKALGRKGKRLFMPMRIALTGRMQGPDVGEVLSILALAEGQVAEEGALMLLPERVAALKAWAAEAGMLEKVSA